MPALPAIACAVALLLSAPQPAAGDLTRQQRDRIVALGPWPPAAVFSRDPSNRVSGDPSAIELGRLLFHDAPLSANGYIACVSCHQTDRAFTDGLARGRGLAPIDRNTIALANLRLLRRYGWDGSSDSVWMASLRAMLDPREMAVDPARVVERFARNDDLACRYRAVFGRAPDHADEALLVNIAKSMAAWQQTLVTGRTPFDDFRDALLDGDAERMARFPAAPQRGLQLFVGRAGCVQCHAGPNFSDGEFHGTGAIAPGMPERGRHDGVRALLDSRFNLLGPYNDDASGSSAAATRQVGDGHYGPGQWRTPSLRNVAATAPYMHDGSIPMLRDAVRHPVGLREDSAQAEGEVKLSRPDLSEADADDLVAFLATLSARAIATPPAQSPSCNALSSTPSVR